MQERQGVFLLWRIIGGPVREDTEVERPVELHCYWRQWRRNAVTRNDLLDGLEMIDSNRLSRAIRSKASHRAEDGFRRGRKKFSEVAQAAEFAPD